jgi:hypothetical protein
MGNRNLTVPLFGFLAFGALLSASKPQVGASISGEAELPSDLGGKMPPSFDQDVARSLTTSIELRPTLSARWNTPRSIAKDRSAPWGSYYSSISISRSIRTRRAVSAIRQTRDSRTPG